ncbi:hypothetical protein C8A05DRAFT_33547 [Staphylotrichum tortipilum]|uniref:CAP-Gly domain-containing protein n=1 Tax=Staphylotrichum tortipilum TaxID=2831512 RepID=A0AAN6MMT5_9PEZI|nr:hypothetical protein C8A05DRAFT_33547 [Staphylotrichum longicolle]
MSMNELSVGRKAQLADQRVGTIRFVGKPSFAPGLWVGIELEDASGKNDGSVQGERYFECAPGHGMFVRPNTLKVLAAPAQFNMNMRQPKRVASPAPATIAAPRVPTPGARPARPVAHDSSAPATIAAPRVPTPGARPARPVAPARKGSGAGVPASKAVLPPAAPAARKGSASLTTKSPPAPSVPTAGPARRASATQKSPTLPPTPAAVAPPAAPRAVVNTPAASSKEVDDLKAKLRVVEKKRMEDREKLLEFDRLKSERDRFERIIQTLQIKFQPQQQELADLKRQLKEAEARFHSVEAMQEEHDSAMELATLDKEMAEEMAEVYKTELDALKEKHEELELEVEVLREENVELAKGASLEDVAAAGSLQTQRDNERLRAALIQLRDLSREQEAELNAQVKGLQEEVFDLDACRRDLDVCKVDLARKDAVIEDLREQLDNALGAEHIIEALTEQTMNQSEKIKELEASINELVELQEIADEMEINHVHNQKEMQEELDSRDAIIAEQARHAALLAKSLEDNEYTLSRFRELVNSLQTDLADMRASHAVTENESEQLSSRSRAMLDLNMKLQISAAKAQVKTIDLELRRMDAQEAEQHLEIVTLFLPDTYQSDKDSVLALLRFSRLAFKASMLNDFIKERIDSQAHSGHENDVFEGCAAVDKLTWLATMCRRFVDSISHCSLEQFASYAGALHELEPVERALNGWIDALKRDELNEKQCSAELQRTIALMTHLSEVHISGDLRSFANDIHTKALLMQTHLETAAVAFATTASMVQARVSPTDDDELAQHFAKKAEGVIAQTRSAKVLAGKTARALEDLKTRSLSLLPETLEAFEQCQSATAELADMSRRIGLDLHGMLHEEGRVVPLTFTDVQACTQRTAEVAFGSVEGDLFSAYATKLRVTASQISDLSTLSTDLDQTQEFDSAAAPWVLRSQQLKVLKNIPIEAEAEARRLKDDITSTRRALAVRDEEFSTAQLKIETLESRMRDAKAKASRISELESVIVAAEDRVASLSESVAKQDRELKALESDRDKWKQVASSARVVSGSGVVAGGSGSRETREQTAEMRRELETMRFDKDALQASILYLREDSRRARVSEALQSGWLTQPLTKAPLGTLVVPKRRQALGELVNLAGGAQVFDLAGRSGAKNPRSFLAGQVEDWGRVGGGRGKGVKGKAKGG